MTEKPNRLIFTTILGIIFCFVGGLLLGAGVFLSFNVLANGNALQENAPGILGSLALNLLTRFMMFITGLSLLLRFRYAVGIASITLVFSIFTVIFDVMLYKLLHPLPGVSPSMNVFILIGSLAVQGLFFVLLLITIIYVSTWAKSEFHPARI
ncbi:MAG TPA: hypothetical protein PK014_14055 [Thermoanaerobaculia bacterium]|nr:hypothetical protein [Thermoanaerobaculia bacterium]HUM31187.1 hypothetical protein [Thermoanaerobaculia bacterium]HXK69576.1 hypothetical protein [Thermoanaerobaculia bacterium]